LFPWTDSRGGPIDAGMDLSAIRRAIIALTAAYSMALQALLLAFVVPLPAALADPLTVLCSGDQGPPAKHDIPCPAVCAAMGHGLTGALLAGIAAIAMLREAYGVAAPLIDWIAPLVFAAGPLPPRGPPAF